MHGHFVQSRPRFGLQPIPQDCRIGTGAILLVGNCSTRAHLNFELCLGDVWRALGQIQPSEWWSFSERSSCCLRCRLLTSACHAVLVLAQAVHVSARWF